MVVKFYRKITLAFAGVFVVLMLLMAFFNTFLFLFPLLLVTGVYIWADVKYCKCPDCGKNLFISPFDGGPIHCVRCGKRLDEDGETET